MDMDMDHGHAHAAGVVPDAPESGSFEGHALLGSFFWIFGLWYTVKHSFLVLDRILDNGKQPTRQKTWRDHHGCAKRTFIFFLHSMDPMFKIIACTVGMFGQMSLGAHWKLRDPVTGEFVEQAEWQYVTMYSFFFFSGLVDILVKVKAPIPPNSDKFFVSLALFIEAYLFFYHPGAASEGEERLYKLLCIAIFGAATAALLWACLPDSNLLPLILTALVLLQGSWFWQIANILYRHNPGHEWDLDSHNTLMFFPLAFCWHLFANISLMFIVYAIANQFVKRGYRFPRGT